MQSPGCYWALDFPFKDDRTKRAFTLLHTSNHHSNLYLMYPHQSNRKSTHRRSTPKSRRIGWYGWWFSSKCSNSQRSSSSTTSLRSLSWAPTLSICSYFDPFGPSSISVLSGYALFTRKGQSTWIARWFFSLYSGLSCYLQLSIFTGSLLAWNAKITGCNGGETNKNKLHIRKFGTFLKVSFSTTLWTSFFKKVCFDWNVNSFGVLLTNYHDSYDSSFDSNIVDFHTPFDL